MAQTVGLDGQSFFGYCGIGEESTYGQGVSPTAYLPIVSDGFSGDNNPIHLNTIRGRDTYEAIPGEYTDDGSLDMPVTPEAIGLLLKAAFGTSSVAVSDPDSDNTDEVGTHTFNPADKIPSLSIELGLGNVQPVRHVGAAIDTLDLEHSSGDRLSLSVDTPAKEPDTSISASTPSYDNLRALVYHDAQIDLFQSDRTADIRDVSISLGNNVEGHIRGSRTNAKMSVGEREVTFDVTLDFENSEVMEFFLGSSNATGPEKSLYEGQFNAKWTSPETIADTSTPYSLEFDAPRVVVNTHDAQLNENDLIAENVEIRVLWDTDAGYDLQATLVNGRTTAY